MRPLRLTLDGFASFREPTVVDFEGLDYFVLVGPTGAGKSSLIDAFGLRALRLGGPLRRPPVGGAGDQPGTDGGARRSRFRRRLAAIPSRAGGSRLGQG